MNCLFSWSKEDISSSVLLHKRLQRVQLSGQMSQLEKHDVSFDIALCQLLWFSTTQHLFYTWTFVRDLILFQLLRNVNQKSRLLGGCLGRFLFFLVYGNSIFRLLSGSAPTNEIGSEVIIRFLFTFLWKKCSFRFSFFCQIVRYKFMCHRVGVCLAVGGWNGDRVNDPARVWYHPTSPSRVLLATLANGGKRVV